MAEAGMIMRSPPPSLHPPCGDPFQSDGSMLDLSRFSLVQGVAHE